MKKYLLFFVFVINLSAFANYYAVGGNLGTNKGLNFLIYNKDDEAIQLNTSFDFNDDSNRFAFTLDKVYSFYPNDSSSLYYGVGLKLSDEDDKNFGVRGVVGGSVFLSNINNNIEIFAELDPTIYLNADDDFIKFEFGLGARYYF